MHASDTCTNQRPATIKPRRVKTKGIPHWVLRALHFNVRTLTKEKREHILKICHELHVCVIVIVEAGFAEDPELLNFAGYDKCYYRAREGTCSDNVSGGGVGIWVRKVAKVSHKLVHKTPDDCLIEALTIRLRIRNRHYLVTGVYIPERNLCTIERLEQILPDGEPRLPGEIRMMLGDFNVHTELWDDPDREDAEGKLLLKWAMQESYMPFNNKDIRTRVLAKKKGAPEVSSPDVSFINGTGAIAWSVITPQDSNVSDHLMVLIELVGHTVPKDAKRRYWNYNNAKWGQFTNDIEEAPELQEEDLNLFRFMKLIRKKAFEHIPRGCVRRFDPLYSKGMENADKELKEALAKHRDAANRDVSWKTLKEARAKCHEAYREAREEQIKELVKSAEKGDPQAWKRITNMAKKQASVGAAVKTPTGVVIFDDEDKANAWVELFKDVATSDKEAPECWAKKLDPEGAGFTKEQKEFKKYIMQELESGIKELKHKRAVGQDEISAEMLSHLGLKAKTVLLGIINKSLETGDVPIEWRTGLVVPVWKDSKPYELLTSYRPVTLTSHVAKLAERMIVRRTLWRISKTFHRQQYGFRAGRSTQDALFDLIIKIYDAWNTEYTRIDPGAMGKASTTYERAMSVLVDFSSAFDTLDHQTIIDALVKKGANVYEINWIRSFITERNTRVRVRESTSKNVVYTQGVPQGTVLGPLLFIVVLDDLLEVLNKDVDVMPGITAKTKVHTLAFADDLTLTISFRDPHAACKQMNAALRKMEDWTKKTGLKINPKKTQAILWTKSTNGQSLDIFPDKCKIKLMGKTIWLEHPSNPNPDPTAEKNPYPGCVKLLGMWLDRPLSFQFHVEHVCKKASLATFQLSMLMGSKGCSYEAVKIFIEAMIQSKLLYGWEAAGKSMSDDNSKKIDSTYLKNGRRSIGAARPSDKVGVMIESDLKPVAAQIPAKHAIAHERRITGDDGLQALASRTLKGRVVHKNGEKEAPQEKADSYLRAACAAEGRTLPKKRNNRLTISVIPPWEAVWDGRITITASLGVSKKKISPEEQHKVSMAAIKAQEEKKKPYLTNYTDGSGDHDLRQRSGAAYVTYDADGNEVDCGKYPAGTMSCSYTAEGIAFHELLKALDRRDDLEGKHILTCLDTQSLLTALLAGPHLQKCIRTDDIWRLMTRLVNKGCTIALQHIFSHCNVPGNVRADTLAEQAATSPTTDEMEAVPVDPRDIKAIILRKGKADRKEVREASDGYRVKNWGPGPRPKQEKRLSKRKQVFASQLRLGQCKRVGTLARAIQLDMPHDCRKCKPKPRVPMVDHKACLMTEDNEYKCPHCEEYVNKKMTSVNKHIDKKHPGSLRIKNKNYRCHVATCNTQLDDYGTLTKHYKVKHPGIECTIPKIVAPVREEPEVLETIDHVVNHCSGSQAYRDHVLLVNRTLRREKKPVPSPTEAMMYVANEWLKSITPKDPDTNKPVEDPAIESDGPYYTTKVPPVPLGGNLRIAPRSRQEGEVGVRSGVLLWSEEPTNAENLLRALCGPDAD